MVREYNGCNCISKENIESSIVLMGAEINRLEQIVKKSKRGYAISRNVGIRNSKARSMLGYIKHISSQISTLRKEMAEALRKLQEIERNEQLCN